MTRRRVRVRSEVGLHARPAARFVQAVVDSGVPVRIGRPGAEAVDGRSILSVLALDVRHGEEVVITAEGPGSGRALDHLADLLGGQG